MTTRQYETMKQDPARGHCEILVPEHKQQADRPALISLSQLKGMLQTFVEKDQVTVSRSQGGPRFPKRQWGVIYWQQNFKASARVLAKDWG